MGLDEERFEDVVAKDFICSICLDVIEYPVALSDCEHIFCKDCIELWMSKNECYCTNWHQYCPLDRKPIRATKLPDEMYTVMYQSLRMRCKNFPYCQAELTVADHEQHDQYCNNSIRRFHYNY